MSSKCITSRKVLNLVHAGDVTSHKEVGPVPTFVILVLMERGFSVEVRRSALELLTQKFLLELLKLYVEWGSTNTAGTSMFKISHIHKV